MKNKNRFQSISVMMYNLERLFNILALVHALPFFFFTTFFTSIFFRFLKFLLLFPSSLSLCLYPSSQLLKAQGLVNVIGYRILDNGQSGEPERKEKRELSRFSEIMNAASVEKNLQDLRFNFFLFPSCVLFWAVFSRSCDEKTSDHAFSVFSLHNRIMKVW